MDQRSAIFARELEKLLSEELATRVLNIINGHSISELWQYKEAVGFIAGLKKALELFDEAETNTNKRLQGN